MTALVAPVVEHFGDLLDLPLLDDTGRPIAFGHGNNLSGGMIGGIAWTLASEFPGLREAYDDAIAAGLDLGDVHTWQAPDGRWIFNMATQVQPGPDARLDAIEEAVRASLILAAQMGVGTLAVPRLGAGIGGLSWEAVAERLGAAVATAGPAAAALLVVTRPADLARPHWKRDRDSGDPVLTACEAAVCACGHEVLAHDLVCETEDVDCECARTQVAALLVSGAVEVTVR